MSDPDLKSLALCNPNYASVRCIKPMPAMVRLHRDQELNSIPENLNQLESYHSDIQPNGSDLDILVKVTSQRFVIQDDQNQQILRSKTSQNCARRNQDDSLEIEPNYDGCYENVVINTNHNANKPLPTDEANELRSAEILLPPDPEAEQDGDHGNEEEDSGPLTWRKKMRNFLHSKPCHIAVIVLVLIDTILVITEILIDLEVVDVDKESVGAEVVHYLSITILSIFMLEIIAKLVADRHHFLSHKIEILDAFVVVTAFAFDIAILFFDENDALVAVGLLILFRLWRIVRIVNGVILSVKTECDERVHALKAKLSEIEEKLKETEERDQREIERLKRILTENGIHYREIPQDDDREQENGPVLRLDATEDIISVDA